MSMFNSVTNRLQLEAEVKRTLVKQYENELLETIYFFKYAKIPETVMDYLNEDDIRGYLSDLGIKQAKMRRNQEIKIDIYIREKD